MKRVTISKDGKRAAIYLRVSTQEQDTERQERDLTAFAQAAGYSVVKIFREKASGTQLARTDRLERDRVIALAQARKIDAVLVTELTRWSRSTVDLLRSLEDLNSYGVSLIAQTGVQFDLSTAQGKMIAGVLAVLSQFERDLLAERVRSGLETARARGKKLGRPCGNRTDSKHRQAVQDLRAAGMSIRTISTKLRIGKDTVSRLIKEDWQVYL